MSPDTVKPHRHRAIWLAAMLLVPVACNGDDANGASDDAISDAATAEIVIADFEYDHPPTIEVGTTVIVRNDDDIQHTWTSVDGHFDSGTLEGGDTFEHTFDEPGDFPFICEFHPMMGSTITVTG